jgi:S1-C subfamily serine protease
LNPFTGEEEVFTFTFGGFVVRSDGLVVTNRGLIEDWENVSVHLRTADGEFMEYTGRVLGRGIVANLALI